MIINSGTIRGLYTSFKTIFNKALDTTVPMWDKVATVVPSTTGESTYAWLGSFPRLREWIGSRQVKNLAASDYTLKNKDFESTVSVPKNAIMDDQIGLYNPMMQDMGQSAALWPDTLVFPLLKKGFKEKCYDGNPFYSESHKIGKLGYTNKATKVLSKDSFLVGRSKMMSLKDEEGNSLNILPNILVVPPALEAMGREILYADQINGTTNTCKGMAELLVVPELAGEDTAWHLLCTTKAIKPIIFQERQKPQFVSKDSETDDNVFMRKEYLYGTDARGNAGYSFWQMAYGSTGTTN
ncbi:MAG: Mu-like prophage major head subunit gpT family protein [Anaerovorax sp.]